MLCDKCQYTNPSKATFCGKCGNKILTPKDNFDYNKHIKKIAVFFFILLTYIAAIHFINNKNSYLQMLLIDITFAAIILIFYFMDFSVINKQLQINGLKYSHIIVIIIIAPLFAVFISYIVNLLNQNIFDRTQTTYYEQFKDSPFPIILSIISIGLFPAIFEEIAFRGIIFNELTKITQLKSTIIISAILFTILHFSLISVFWIFPIGILFGYYRARYKTLWYGILGHFIYNSSIVLFEILQVS